MIYEHEFSSKSYFELVEEKKRVACVTVVFTFLGYATVLYVLGFWAMMALILVEVGMSYSGRFDRLNVEVKRREEMMR